MNNKIWFFILLLVSYNLYSLFTDKYFDRLITISNKKYQLLDTININEVYSNSFGFVSNKILNLDTIKSYKIKHINLNKIYFFKLNIIKHKDSLYFLQKINFFTKQKSKISKGYYLIYANK